MGQSFMKELKLRAHLFICTNTKKDGSSCGARGSQELRDLLKKSIGSKLSADGFDNSGVRINSSGCLGHCENGIVAVCYPSGTWKTHLKNDSMDELVDVVKTELT
jgi:(2Fe-2S) ferredoxin